MNASPAPGPSATAESATPQVRTLLLTDLCESTTLVERLGDALAAALFREHDRLVLELQQRWRGRLIDRSDGLLLLFERPIDGLGFALDYMRGLHEMGNARKLKLQARAGLHVGEVLTWHNSDEAVRAGAKSLEVEGLAKPLAARLMSLARPGQILLSAVAEPMSHRAASELGERGRHLVWKSYGRWRFKGVPNAQEIFEVGEPGLAALRMPAHTAKAWRDIPLWRRPAALAAEVLLLVGLGTGAWFLTRSPPAIAFNERDWVVVGDLRNLTGQPVLDESLEQAFRISLEQSRYVNVLSDLKVRDTLGLMKRKPDSLLDRATASEVALRDGARAVILPTVAEVGGRVRVSAEVIDPHTQTTVYAESADGSGAESTLDSIDKVTAELRGKLGEALSAIDHDSAPLPQVSTRNLDALKAYALGEKRKGEGDAIGAMEYFRRALELDPQFALAQVGIGRVQLGEGKLVEGRRNLEAGLKLRDHLTAREAMNLDALLARFGPVPALLSRWRQLAEMYPDNWAAQSGLANDGWIMANVYEQGLPHVRIAQAKQNVGHASSFYTEGILLLGMDRYDAALRAFESAQRFGHKGGRFLYAYAYEAQRDYGRADQIFAGQGRKGLSAAGLDQLDYRFNTAIDRGQWAQVPALLDKALPIGEADDPLYGVSTWQLWGIGARVLAGSHTGTEELRKQLRWVEQHAAQLDASYPASSDQYRLALGYLAALSGDSSFLAMVLKQLEGRQSLLDYPLSGQMHEVLLAEASRLSGQPGAAVDRLGRIVAREDALVATHAALLRALRADGKYQAALAQASWLAEHRGRAFVERGISSLLQPVSIADTTLALLDAAELEMQLGRSEASRRMLARFLSAWPREQLPAAVEARVAKLKG